MNPVRASVGLWRNGFAFPMSMVDRAAARSKGASVIMNAGIVVSAAILAAVLAPSGVSAHHGWGSYDAANPLTIEGVIETSKFENPHATITVRANDKVWTVTLAPTSRMLARGASAEMIAVGANIKAYGYASRAEKDEMRAERITAGDKTIEMR